MNKRAMAEGVNVIRILVLCIFIAVPLIAFGVHFASSGKTAGEGESCKLSILAASKTKAAAEVWKGQPLSISCPSNKIKIKKRDVSKGGKVDWNLLNGIIAKELYFCHRKTLGGEYNPFESTISAKSVCVVCSDIDTSDINHTELVGLELYLAVKKVPGQRQSFYEATRGKQVDTAMLKKLKEKMDKGRSKTYHLDEDHVVIWRVAQGSRWKEVIITSIVLGPAALVIAYFFPGDDFGSEYLFLPESALTGSMADAVGMDNIPPDKREDYAEAPFCEHLLWE